MRFPAELVFPIRKLRDAQKELQFAHTHEFVSDEQFMLAVESLCDPTAKPNIHLDEIRVPQIRIH